MTDSTFHKVGKSEKRMFGPPCLLMCGYRNEEQEQILSLIEACGLSGHAVIFACEDDEDVLLRDMVRMESGKGRGLSSKLARAIIMSGVTEKELHRLMSGYRNQKFAPQLWATLTPISEGWALKALLKELAAEAEAFRKSQSQKPQQKTWKHHGEDHMELKKYFDAVKGTGIMASADSDGKVDAAVYSRPHFMEDGRLAFIMADRLTHHNLQSNPYAMYVFTEEGPGYNGRRLYLKKTGEEQDTDRLYELRRRKHPEKGKGGGPRFLVFFELEKVLPLIGAGREEDTL